MSREVEVTFQYSIIVSVDDDATEQETKDVAVLVSNDNVFVTSDAVIAIRPLPKEED